MAGISDTSRMQHLLSSKCRGAGDEWLQPLESARGCIGCRGILKFTELDAKSLDGVLQQACGLVAWGTHHTGFAGGPLARAHGLALHMSQGGRTAACAVRIHGSGPSHELMVQPMYKSASWPGFASLQSLPYGAGVAWTPAEHKLFLLGLQKLGKVRWLPYHTIRVCRQVAQTIQAVRFGFPLRYPQPS